MSFAPLPLAVMFNIGALMGWSDLAPGNGSLHYVLGEGAFFSILIDPRPDGTL